jgi:hypothetical protein
MKNLHIPRREALPAQVNVDYNRSKQEINSDQGKTFWNIQNIVTNEKIRIQQRIRIQDVQENCVEHTLKRLSNLSSR